MGTPAHKQDTKTFDELTFSEQAKSITAMINNLKNAITHHQSHAKDPSKTKQKCVEQLERLVERVST